MARARDRGMTVSDEDSLDAEPQAEGFSSALVIVTTLLLLGACIVMQQALKKHFNAGWFADKAQQTAPAD